MKNSRWVKYAELISLFAIVYVILNESLSFLTVSLGIVVGFLAIWLTNKILDIDYVEMFHIRSSLILIYAWVIIRDTYVMGWDTIVRTFNGKMEPNFIRYKSKLNDEFLTALLANAITMPPGTITVDRQDREMTILTVGLDKDEFVKATYETIEKKFERFDVKGKG
ncbi:MAG: Na+/H+ antiporter subunit E [Defluviitaleaceae bacterium]|nr:Na+/H+ antiporter subunit E [Defluviitaleaceae bacterium]